MLTLRLVLSLAILTVPTLALAQTDGERIEALEKRMEALEQKLDEVGKKLEEIGSAEEREKRAAASFSEINQLASQGKMAEAKTKMATFSREYGNTQAARRAMSLQRELAVIGKEAPKSLEVEKWYQGDCDLSGGKATLLVFWEEWCPHCKREVPKVETLYASYKDQGLQVVGLTKITKSATEEKVQSFITDKGLTYPMAKEKGGTMSSYFNVSGIPAAAVVKDGKIVWRGHPARLSETLIKSWL
jgi:thiol-disulfide isomerase/thioredoxin